MIQENILPAGIILVLIGIGLIIIGVITNTKDNANTKFSVVGFFGFIPFGIANNNYILYFSIMFLGMLTLFAAFSMKRFI